MPTSPRSLHDSHTTVSNLILSFANIAIVTSYNTSLRCAAVSGQSLYERIPCGVVGICHQNLDRAAT